MNFFERRHFPAASFAGCSGTTEDRHLLNVNPYRWSARLVSMVFPSRYLDRTPILPGSNLQQPHRRCLSAIALSLALCPQSSPSHSQPPHPTIPTLTIALPQKPIFREPTHPNPPNGTEACHRPLPRHTKSTHPVHSPIPSSPPSHTAHAGATRTHPPSTPNASPTLAPSPPPNAAPASISRPERGAAAAVTSHGRPAGTVALGAREPREEGRRASELPGLRLWAGVHSPAFALRNTGDGCRNGRRGRGVAWALGWVWEGMGEYFFFVWVGLAWGDIDLCRFFLVSLGIGLKGEGGKGKVLHCWVLSFGGR